MKMQKLTSPVNHFTCGKVPHKNLQNQPPILLGDEKKTLTIFGNL